jgi:hypothetical protein
MQDDVTLSALASNQALDIFAMHFKITASIHSTLVVTRVARHGPTTMMELNAVIDEDHAIIDVRQKPCNFFSVWLAARMNSFRVLTSLAPFTASRDLDSSQASEIDVVGATVCATGSNTSGAALQGREHPLFDGSRSGAGDRQEGADPRRHAQQGQGNWQVKLRCRR